MASVESQVQQLLQQATPEALVALIQQAAKGAKGPKKAAAVTGPPGKYVFYFSKTFSEGKPGMKAILGGKVG